MCWITRKVNNIKPEIAEDNIVVYKRMKVYSKRKWYTPWKKTPIAYHSEIYDYRYLPYGVNPILELKVEECWRGHKIENGYHSFLTCPTSNPYYPESYKAVKCVIPKGSTYYVNEYGEVVSSNIVITDKLVKFLNENTRRNS